MPRIPNISALMGRVMAACLDRGEAEPRYVVHEIANKDFGVADTEGAEIDPHVMSQVGGLKN